jgi:Na+-transporting methylmalonyl-CoA/oxaloacetate decarboxylase gamma subunit
MPELLAQAWTLSDGFWLSVTGMLIVFSALVLVSLFISWLPRGLGWINEVFPEAPDHHHHPPPSRKSGDGIDEELVVAIAAAIDARRRR